MVDTPQRSYTHTDCTTKTCCWFMNELVCRACLSPTLHLLMIQCLHESKETNTYLLRPSRHSVDNIHACWLDRSRLM